MNQHQPKFEAWEVSAKLSLRSFSSLVDSKTHLLAAPGPSTADFLAMDKRPDATYTGGNTGSLSLLLNLLGWGWPNQASLHWLKQDSRRETMWDDNVTRLHGVLPFVEAERNWLVSEHRRLDDEYIVAFENMSSTEADMTADETLGQLTSGLEALLDTEGIVHSAGLPIVVSGAELHSRWERWRTDQAEFRDSHGVAAAQLCLTSLSHLARAACD